MALRQRSCRHANVRAVLTSAEPQADLTPQMAEPVRLRVSPVSAFEHQLLHAGARDQPSVDLRRRTLEALGLHDSLARASGA
ncbi:MAG: hypothetical protein ACOY0T_30465 [Myxococcota bacterium]